MLLKLFYDARRARKDVRRERPFDELRTSEKRNKAGKGAQSSKANSQLMQVPKGYIILLNEVMDLVRDEA